MPIGGCAPCAPRGPSAGGFDSLGGCGSTPRSGGLFGRGGVFGGGGLIGGRGQSPCNPMGGGGGCCVQMDCCSTTPAGIGSTMPLDGGFAGNGQGAQTAPGAQAAQGAQAPQGAQNAGNASEFEKRLLELVNQVRRQLGLSEVQWDENVAQVARRSAAAKTHTGAPEVLAPRGYSSPEDAMNAWRQSPGHWSIITDPSFTRMGGGWVGDGAAMTFG